MQTDSYTNQELRLHVGEGHTLYVHDWGNLQAAVPFIFLHGGPGDYVKDKYKRRFDPTKQRVIFFDQRGSGLSTPAGLLEHNTTQDLVSDITKIADKLKIQKFVLHGTSWGSALALVYAIEHPERVAALVIGGVFTGSKAEADWLDQGQVKTFYPDVWQTYLDRTPEQYRDDPTAYHFDRVVNGTPEEQRASGYAYECLESSVYRFDDRFQPDDIADYDPSGIRMEMHYLQNSSFIPEGHILGNASKLTMPVYIVQGRYDMVCPPKTAYQLYQALPDGHIYLTLGGHAVDHESENVFAAIMAGL